MNDWGTELKKWTLEELAEHVGGQFKGDRTKTVGHVSELRNATEDAISHCSVGNQVRYLAHTRAGIVILTEEFFRRFDGNCIISDNPRVAFAKVVRLLHVQPPVIPGIHESAIIGKNCDIHHSVAIGANAVIGDDVSLARNVIIGAGSILGNRVSVDENTAIDTNVSLYRNVKIGKNCLIYASVVIGASGFSYEWDGDKWVGIPNIGRVVIGDFVDIGACTSIDRGSIGETRIGNGVKIDNNVQIGHNVQIGEHSIIAGNVGIAGSARIGKRCKFGGQVAVAQHVSVADDTVVLADTLVVKSLTETDTYSSGIPAYKATIWRRALVRLKRTIT